MSEDLGGQVAGADPMTAMLSQMMTEDPRLRLVAELMRARDGAPAATPAEETLARTRAAHERLRDAYVSLRERDDELAAALGACAACWGESPTCRHCRGEGAPGAFMPDWELFARYIMPAVRRRATLARTSTGRHTANPQEE